MNALSKLLMAIGVLGISITAAIMVYFIVREDHYFPGRYEVALGAAFHVITAWAGYGFICAVFFSLKSLLGWRYHRAKKIAEQGADGDADEAV